MATDIFPYSPWLSGTNQNSVPANDNAMRAQVVGAPALAIESTQPGSPAEDDIYILGAAPSGAQWSSFAQNDVVIFKGGTWYAFAPLVGWLKFNEDDGETYRYDSGAWAVFSSGGGGGGGLSSEVNMIINGRFNINQRQKSGSVVLAAGAYGHDRWKAGASGCTYTFSSSGGITTITISAGSLIQVVEGINVRSGTHVLTWDGTAQGKFSGGSYSATGVTGSLTGGSNATLEFNTGTLTSVQLIPGSTPQAYLEMGDAHELFRCQRYCFRFSLVSSNTTVFMSEAVFASTTNGFVSGMFAQAMYASPTFVAEGAASQYRVYDPVANVYTTTSAVSGNAVTSAQFYLFNFSIASGGTAARRCYFVSNVQQTNSVRFEAEI